MYMGLELKGRHTIALRYCTPYIVPGMILTVLGLILFAGIVISYRRKGNKRKGKTGEMSRLSVVLPACNEEPMVEKTCRTLRELLGQAGIRYELVLVDDGSSDGTWAAIEKVSRKIKM